MAPPTMLRMAWEAELRRQEVAERAFLQMQSSRYSERRMAGTLRKAQQVCAELDERERRYAELVDAGWIVAATSYRRLISRFL